MVRLLLAFEAGDMQLHDGEPCLMLGYRPGSPARSAQLEGADAVTGSLVSLLRDLVADHCCERIEAAHDRDGTWRGERVTGEIARVALTPAMCAALIGEPGWSRRHS
jgi:hypothetical protein